MLHCSKDTVTLYYKDDVLLKQEAVSHFFVSKCKENPSYMLKTAPKVGKTLERFYKGLKLNRLQK